ncbi:MAG: hypothetical protein IKU32_00545 [Clostridia bacterium]|nr:hypothetical protein [Clostridia bacterium]
MFNILWTVLLGIAGGIISSVIVSRVFMIQGEYQQEIKFVEGIIRKLGIIAGCLFACKTVFEVSFDQDIRMENEMKEKGYKCEMEYYIANKDKDWISTSELLKTFRVHLSKTIEAANGEILSSNITNKELNTLLRGIERHLHSIETAKELNFSIINEFKKEEKQLIDEFEKCKRVSGKQLAMLVLKDKVMIVLYLLVGVLIISTCLAFVFSW